MVSEINVFLHSTQKFKMAAKKWRENDFWEKLPDDSANIKGGQKFHGNGSISYHFQDKCILEFYTEIQYGRQKSWGKQFFPKLPGDSADTLGVKNLPTSLYLVPFLR